MLTYRKLSALSLFALMITFVAGLAIALGAVLSAAQAAPIGMLKQLRVPTSGSSPEHITQSHSCSPTPMSDPGSAQRTQQRTAGE